MVLVDKENILNMKVGEGIIVEENSPVTDWLVSFTAYSVVYGTLL